MEATAKARLFSGVLRPRMASKQPRNGLSSKKQDDRRERERKSRKTEEASTQGASKQENAARVGTRPSSNCDAYCSLERQGCSKRHLVFLQHDSPSSLSHDHVYNFEQNPRSEFCHVSGPPKTGLEREVTLSRKGQKAKEIFFQHL